MLTVNDILEHAKTYKPTPEDTERLRIQFIELSNEMEARTKSMRVTEELLNRVYDL